MNVLAYEHLGKLVDADLLPTVFHHSSLRPVVGSSTAL